MARTLVPFAFGALALFLPAAGLAQTESVVLTASHARSSTPAAESLTAYAESLSQRRRGRRTGSTANPVAIRVGAALGDSSGLLLGLDLGVPSISIGQGWTGRLDFDIWGLGDNNTNVGIILNQITSSDGKTYLGFGLGIVAGDQGGLGVKLLVGTSLSDRVDLEFNIILSDNVTPAIVARIHL